MKNIFYKKVGDVSQIGSINILPTILSLHSIEYQRSSIAPLLGKAIIIIIIVVSMIVVGIVIMVIVVVIICERPRDRISTTRWKDVFDEKL